MSLERRIERLEQSANGTNGKHGDPYLHVARVTNTGSIELRRMDGATEYVSYAEFETIVAQFGRMHPFIVLDT